MEPSLSVLVDAPYPIVTPRLLIRPLMPGDGAALHAAIAESVNELAEWFSFVHKGVIPPPEEAEITARTFYAKFILRTIMHYAVFERETNQFLGMLGLLDINWLVRSLEIGYWCRTSRTGNGFASEAANAMTRYAFNQLNMRRVTIICDDENEKSCAIAERLHFFCELVSLGLFDKPGDEALRKGRQYVRFDLTGLPDLSVSW